MRTKIIASAAALALAMGFSSAAFAQTMIGNQEVSAGDYDRVKSFCEALQLRENQASGLATQEEPVDENNDGVPDTESEDPDTSATIGNIDTDLITVEACIEAGFIEATP